LYESIRDGRAQATAQVQAAFGTASEKMKEIQARILKGSELTERARYVRVSTAVYRTYPINRTLASPQDLIASFMDYQVHCKDSFLENTRLPSADGGHLRTFANGVYSVTLRVDGEVLTLCVVHSIGCMLSESYLGTLRQATQQRDGSPLTVDIIPAHSLCSLVFCGIRCGLRLLHRFNSLSGVTVAVAISPCGVHELYTCGPHDHLFKDMPLRHLRGPAELRSEITEQLNWPNASELDRVEESIATEIVSAFNVREREQLQVMLANARRHAGAGV
jgi:hypothetical protein